MLHLSRFRFLRIRSLIHSFAQFIDVAQHLTLFITQAFEFSFNFFTLFVGRCGTQFGLKLLQSFIHHLLSASQLFQTVQDLNLFTLLCSLLLLLLSLLCGFVAISLVVQFQLLQLLLRRAVPAATSASALLLLLANLKLGGSHFEQCLHDGLFN